MSASRRCYNNEMENFTAPLGSAASGRLVFTSGADGITIGAGATIAALAHGRLRRWGQNVQVKDGLLIVQTRCCPSHGLKGYPQKWLNELTLNAALPWEIEFRGGASRINAILHELQLRSFDILGGASQVVLALSKPAQTAYIYIAGGASRVTILRPAGVGVQVQVQGGVRELVLDGQRLSAAVGDASLESPGYSDADSRWDICIAGGASQMTIAPELC